MTSKRTIIAVLAITVAIGLAVAPVAGGVAVGADEGDDVGPDSLITAELYGNVTVAETGEPIGEEVDITAVAVVEGEEETDTLTVEEDGSYGGSGADDPKLTVPNPDDGTFDIYVDGQLVAEDEEWPGAGPQVYDVEVSQDDLDRDGADFQIVDTDTNSPIEEGEQLNVTADIENLGDVQDTQDVELVIDGETEDSQELSLGVDETDEVELTYQTEDGDRSITEVEVHTENDVATVPVTITGPPFFAVDIVDIPDEVVAGDDVAIDFEVENTGDEGEQDIVVSVDGEAIETFENVSLDTNEVFDETATYTTDGDDVPEIDVEVESDDDNDSATVTVNERFADVTFDDQATNSSSYELDADRSDAGVLLEDLESNVDSAVVVTYTDGDDEIIAGLETFDAEDLDGSDEIIALENDTGAPGEHTAHVIPVDELSDDQYVVGDVVSDATADAVLADDDATVFEGTVEFEDQTFDIETDHVNVSTATLLDGDADDTEFVVVIHPLEDGDVQPPIGWSDVLTGEETDLQIDLEAGEELTESGEFVAMLNESTGDFGPAFQHTDATEGVLDGGVTDDAEITVLQEAEPALQNLDIAGQGDEADLPEGDNESVTVDLENVGDLDGEFEVELTIDNGDDYTETQTVEVGGLETETVEFENATGDLSPDEYDVTIDAEELDRATEDSIAGTLEVRERVDPTPELTGLDIAGQGDDASISEGDNETVAVDLENVGDDPGEFEVELTIDNGEEYTANDTVSLDAGEEQTIEFEDATGDLAVGDYNVTVDAEETTYGLTDTIEGDLSVLVPAEPELSNLDIAGQGDDAEIIEGDDEAVSVDLENLGEADGEFEVTLIFENEETHTESQTVDIDGETTETITFEEATGDLAPDEYDVTVEAEETTQETTDTIEGNLTVLMDATPELSDLDIAGDGEDATIVEGDDEDVSVEVENVGEVAGTFDVTLEIDGEDWTETTDELGAGENETVVFESVTGDLDIGEYDVTVTADDAELVGSLTVTSPAEIDLDVDIDPNVANETATYEAAVTYEAVAGDLTAQFISIDFGTDDVDVSAVLDDADLVSVIDSDDEARDIADVLQLDDSTIVIQLAEGEGISDPAVDDTVTVTVEEVENAPAGEYDMTVGLHEPGDSILDAAAPAFAEASDDYELFEERNVVYYAQLNEPGDIVTTPDLRAAINDWRLGEIETSTLRDVISAWRTQDPVSGDAF